MAPINWFWTYLEWMRSAAYRPLEIVRWQGGTGGCWGGTLTYAMEHRAMLQGYQPRQLSMPYSLYMDGRYDNNGSYVDAVMQDAMEGICIESLMPMPAYAGVETWTPEYGTKTWAVLQTAPSAAARADAPNQIVTDWGRRFIYYGLDDLKAQCLAAIAAGYPLFVLTPERTHVMCGVGGRDEGLEVVDTRSMNADTRLVGWSQIGGIEGVLRGVRFVGATMGPPPKMLSKTGVILPPLIPPVTPPPVGNTQMLIDTFKQQANALTRGQITAAQLAALDATRAQIVPDATVVVPPPGAPGTTTPPTVPPPPPGTSPIGTTVPPAASITDDLGAIWTIDHIGEVRRNGARAGGFFASKLAWQPEERNGDKLSIAATNKGNGSVSFWNGKVWTWAGR